MQKPSEDDLHRWASDALEDALLFLTPKDVLACLKKLDRLDGHLFKILVGQLDGSIPPKTYRNRFGLLRAKGKPPTLAKEPGARFFIARAFNRRLKQSNRKSAIFETCKELKIGKTVLEEILAEDKSVYTTPTGFDSA